MALSNLSKDHTNNLLLALNENKILANQIITEKKGQHATIAKLEILYRQMEFLKTEINRVMEEGAITSLLNKANIKCMKCPGTTYHLFQKINKHNEILNDKDTYYLSKLHPRELGDLTKDNYLGSFLLKDDFTWLQILDY
tara:strand:+ start:492 stop:911 length:420 start_codon:yes stop_codon:yes gene_type:complete